MRNLALTAAVCIACLAGTALGYGHAVVNPDVPVDWYVADLTFAAIALLLPGSSLLAGGLIGNALAAHLCAGVPDFIPIAGRLLSPGDVAIVTGFAPILATLAYRYSKPVIAESFASDC